MTPEEKIAFRQSHGPLAFAADLPNYVTVFDSRGMTGAHLVKIPAVAAVTRQALDATQGDPYLQGEIKQAFITAVAKSIGGPNRSFHDAVQLHKAHLAQLEECQKAIPWGSGDMRKDHIILSVGDECEYTPTGHVGEVTSIGHGKFYLTLPSGHTISAERSHLVPTNFPAAPVRKDGFGSLQKFALREGRNVKTADGRIGKLMQDHADAADRIGVIFPNGSMSLERVAELEAIG